MDNISAKLDAFNKDMQGALGKDFTRVQTDLILDVAFGVIKEGIVNMTINGNLSDDINALYLETVLDEPDWDDDSAVYEAQRVRRADDIFAGGYNLDDPSTAEQIKIIEDEPDQEKLIDLINGVSVWEPLEYKYTCKQFLKEIN